MIMLAAGFTVILPNTSASVVSTGYDIEDIGPEVRSESPDLGAVKAAGDAEGVASETTTASILPEGTVQPYYVGSDGATSFMEFEKRGEGQHCEIWVATDLGFGRRDPRNADTGKLLITDQQVTEMIDEFDGVIYPTDAAYFGAPDALDGSNAVISQYGYPTFPTDDAGKVMIMVFNIVDERYSDPSYPSYVAGFFSPTSEYYYDRNIIHVDNWDWANRTGADSARPYVYESTVAHEFQHLIHADLDSDEDTWLNEGCSMYAEILCGYGTPWPYIEEYFATPDNSLTEWEDQGGINAIADYGAAALFMIYMSDHYGGSSFISALAANEENSVASVIDTMATQGFPGKDFDQVYTEFMIANLLASNDLGLGVYSYSQSALDFSSPEAAAVKTLAYSSASGRVGASAFFGTSFTFDGYDTGLSALNGYGTDVIKVNGLSGRTVNVYFDGDDSALNGWTKVAGKKGSMWWSGASDLRDAVLRGSADLTGLTTATLSFDTNYAIEEGWDFGFVQVSTDGGATWTSLSNKQTIGTYDPQAHPGIIDNLPGLTGSGKGKMAFDLTPYAGQKILYQFRYMTDWGYTESGWYVDNVKINGVLVDNAENVQGLTAVYPEADFTVTMVATGNGVEPLVQDVSLNDLTEQGMASVALPEGYENVYLLVFSDEGPVDYTFSVY